MNNWFEKCYRQSFQNLGGDEVLSKFSSKKLARYWKNAGAELVYFDVVHQRYVMYPSKVSVCEPVLAGRDLIGEFVDECRKIGIHSGAYLTPFEHASLSDGHPEYSQTKPTARYIPDQSGPGKHTGPAGTPRFLTRCAPCSRSVSRSTIWMPRSTTVCFPVKAYATVLHAGRSSGATWVPNFRRDTT